MKKEEEEEEEAASRRAPKPWPLVSAFLARQPYVLQKFRTRRKVLVERLLDFGEQRERQGKPRPLLRRRDPWGMRARQRLKKPTLPFRAGVDGRLRRPQHDFLPPRVPPLALIHRGFESCVMQLLCLRV